jgi:hypothetical protein
VHGITRLSVCEIFGYNLRDFILGGGGMRCALIVGIERIHMLCLHHVTYNIYRCTATFSACFQKLQSFEVSNTWRLIT